MAALGPDPGLKVEVLKDRLTAPTGKALVRVVQASLKQNRVTVSYGSDVLAKQLGFSIMPKGGASMGFGGTAPRQPASPAPWVLMIATGVLLIVGGSGLLRRSRRAITTAQR